MEKKKMIPIIIASVIVLILIIATISFFVWKNINESTGKGLEKLQSKLEEKQEYIITISDDNNKEIYAKKGNKAYKYISYNGNQYKYIIKDGNTYLIKDEEKTYYTFLNNEIDLEKYNIIFNNLKEKKYTTGNQKINDKNYKYYEYEGNTGIELGDFQDMENNVKTRFYFQNDNLVYVKTVGKDKEETLKVDIKYNIDDKLFNIPSEYKPYEDTEVQE